MDPIVKAARWQKRIADLALFAVIGVPFAVAIALVVLVVVVIL